MDRAGHRKEVDVRVSATLIVVLPVTICGCGLLHVPYAVTLPSKPLRSVYVLDRETGQPVADTHVWLRVTRWENWMEPMSPWITCEGPVEDTSAMMDNERNECMVSWEAVRREDGRWEVAPRTFCGWVCVWCPLPPVLGCFLYYTYDGVLEVSAPGYRTLWISDSAVVRAIKWGKGADEAARRPGEGGIALRDSALVVYLARRSAPSPESKTTSR